jgi:hypothetical protein
MKTHLTLLAAAIASAGSLACQAPRSTPPDDAVYCAKCETVWIEVPDFDDPYQMSTVSAKTMQCPDCESAVARFFETGDLGHGCSTCGTLVHCTAD